MKILSGLCFLLLCGAGIARGDTVVFKNGDRLTGTMTSATRDHIVLASEVAGPLNIPADKVASMTVDKPAVIVSVAQEAIRGQVQLTATGDWQVVDGGKTQLVKAASVQAIMTAEAYHQQFEENRKLWNGWKGVANFGYSIQSGDQRTRSFSGTATATKEGSFTLIFRPHWRLNWDLTTLLSRAEQQQASVRSDTLSTNLREDRLISRQDFLFAAAGLDHIDAQGLYLRQRFGAGYGRDLITNARISLKGLLGVNYIHAKFDIGSSKTSAEASVGETFGWQAGRRVHLDHVLNFYPSLSGGSGVRGDTRTSLAFKLNNRLTFNTGVVDFYLSRPPVGSHSNNIALTTGLGVVF